MENKDTNHPLADKVLKTLCRMLGHAAPKGKDMNQDMMVSYAVSAWVNGSYHRKALGLRELADILILTAQEIEGEGGE